MIKKKCLLVALSIDFAYSLALESLKKYAQIDEVINDLWDIDVLIFKRESPTLEIINEVLLYDADIIGFSCYSWNINDSVSITRVLKNIKMDKTLIIAGGPEVSYVDDRDVMNFPFDVIVVGEGEIPFKNILKSFMQESPELVNINGIILKEGLSVIRTQPVNTGINLNLLSMSSLLKKNKSRMREFPVVVETSRGCAYRCHFCLGHKNQTTMRFKDVELVKEELQFLVKYAEKGIWIVDSVFNIDVKRLEAFSEILKEYKKTVTVEISINNLNDEIIKLLRISKIDVLEIGIQSTDSNVLSYANRNELPIKKIEAFMPKINSEFIVNLHLIYGLPGDSYNSFKESVRFAIEQSPSSIFMFRFCVLKGSEIWNRRENYKLVWVDEPPYEIIQTLSYDSGELLRMENLAFSVTLLFNCPIASSISRIFFSFPQCDIIEILEEFSSFMQRSGLKQIEQREIFNIIGTEPQLLGTQKYVDLLSLKEMVLSFFLHINEIYHTDIPRNIVIGRISSF